MISISGTVKDYFSGVGISGAEVNSISVTGTSFFDSVTSSGGGQFNIEVPNSGQVIYIPYKQGFRGYTKQLANFVDDVDLYLRSGTSAAPTVSGSVFASIYDAVLTTSTDVRDVKSTPCHAVAITSAGVDIFDPTSKTNIGYISRSGGYSAVYVDPNICQDVQVYLGTATSGLFRLDLEENSGDLSSFLVPSFSTASLNIRTLDGNSSGDLAIGTASGIDVVTSSGIFSHNSGTPVETCKIDESGDLYYSPTGSGLYVKYGPIGASWSSPDYVLNDSSIPSILSNIVNDIEIVTVVSGNNFVFLATNSGINTYEEVRATITGSNINSFTSSLSSSTLNVTGIEVHAGATYNSGQITYSTLEGENSGVVNVFSLASGSVSENLNIADFETNLRRAGTVISGSGFVHRRGS